MVEVESQPLCSHSPVSPQWPKKGRNDSVGEKPCAIEVNEEAINKVKTDPDETLKLMDDGIKTVKIGVDETPEHKDDIIKKLTIEGITDPNGSLDMSVDVDDDVKESTYLKKNK